MYLIKNDVNKVLSEPKKRGPKKLALPDDVISGFKQNFKRPQEYAPKIKRVYEKLISQNELPILKEISYKTV